MVSKIITILANTGLLVVAVAVLATPLLLGQLIGSYQSGALGESTQATANQAGSPTPAIFTAQPNPQQFTPYIEFDPQPVITANSYQTSVTFTAFTKQQATYNSLLNLTNTTDRPLVVQVTVGTLSGLADNSQVWLTLTSDSQTSSSLTTQAANLSDATLKVASARGFNSGSVVVDGQVLSATTINQTTLTLAEPLTKAVPVGQTVYFGPAYFAHQAKPTLGSTHPLNLQPHQSASLNLIVATQTGDLDTNQLVLPLTITLK